MYFWSSDEGVYSGARLNEFSALGEKIEDPGIDDLAKISLLQSQNAVAHGRLLQAVITQPFADEGRPAKMRGLQSFHVLSRGGRQMQVVFGYLVAARARVRVNAV